LNRRWRLAICGLALGSTAGVAAVTFATAAAQQIPSSPRAVLDATHVPPLLTVPGDDVELTYDVHCAPSGKDDVDEGCKAAGSVFIRPVDGGVYDEIPLARRGVDGDRQLVASVPDSLASHRVGFEYYALLEAPEVGGQLVLPAGGADAPHVSRPLADTLNVSLGRHVFGNGHRAGVRVASAAWGEGAADVGLEQGRSPSPIGAAAFDVDASGAVVILDQAHRRFLRWRRGARVPARVPVSVRGGLADMAVASDGSIYVLESTAEAGRNPLVRRFDDAGRELEAIETAERTSSQIRMARTGPHVLGQPSHHWMPVAVDGVPASPATQLRHGRPGRALRTDGEIVVFRHEDEARLALIAGRKVTRSWRLTSDTPLAEVQLAEPLGQRLVVVVRVYDDTSDEFAVLVLDRTGVVDRFTLDSADWAETAPLGRFRLVGRSLYRLGSTPSGAFVDRFDLEVR
jgi:hypothetical protein